MSGFEKGNRKQKNPWNNVQQQKKTTVQITNPKQNVPSSETKFKEAQKQLQAAVQKFSKNYESSSEEEDVESENVISSILKHYAQTGGKSENLRRTEDFLEDAFVSGAAICLICISAIKRNDSIWSCSACYCFFHLMCIQRWSKDTITQQKQVLEQNEVYYNLKIAWCCPKCRHEYAPTGIPDEYKCFCKKCVNPEYQPLLVPHSCGEMCGKDLKPFCGHGCLLLCHPGPCPPCPKTVGVKCYCGSRPPKLQRCSNKEWSCGSPCRKLLTCAKHKCAQPCHGGDCQPCQKKSIQKCLCGSTQKLRDCATPWWQCEKVCNKPLDCGHHNCPTVCHAGECNSCILSKPRTCPCGKTRHTLPCTKETPTCGDTCGKLFECGAHVCNQRCHKDNCGTCLETITKSCRCALHTREVQCRKPYLCETKCKRMKDCNRHPCNRKCCDGNCPLCEKPCGRTLSCGNHKCGSICHRGPCYPCGLTESVSCRCGDTSVRAPCGRKYRTRPPKCGKFCGLPPDCHHERRQKHRCHFGDCPSCTQTCGKSRSGCEHVCPAPCHSSVLIKVEGQRASMPWEETGPRIERKALPCPECVVAVSVTCLGGHETCGWPCHSSKPLSCQRPCGRPLPCGNHRCSFLCHAVESGCSGFEAGTNCENCDSACKNPRPEGCQHNCPRPCHPGPCPPCKNMLRIRCHCGLNQPYVSCYEWTSSKNREELQSCKNQCPLNFECGHRCRANCHSGPCPNPKLCKKKVKVSCGCKRIKKEISCELARVKSFVVECDEVCVEKVGEERRLRELQSEQRKREEEENNLRELERYEKKFQVKRKAKHRKLNDTVEKKSFEVYWFIIPSLLVLFISFLYFIFF